jgi:hypothetical protein
MTALFRHERRAMRAEVGVRLKPSGWGGGFPIPARVTPKDYR